jgi:hypothetical protein
MNVRRTAWTDGRTDLEGEGNGHADDEEEEGHDEVTRRREQSRERRTYRDGEAAEDVEGSNPPAPARRLLVGVGFIRARTAATGGVLLRDVAVRLELNRLGAAPIHGRSCK